MADVLTNPRSDRVRSVRSLAQRPVRQRTGRFVVEGPQGVREAVRCAADRVVDVYLTAQAMERYAADIAAPARAAGLWVHQVTDEVLDSAASLAFEEAGNRLTAQRALLVYFLRPEIVNPVKVDDARAELEHLLAGIL